MEENSRGNHFNELWAEKAGLLLVRERSLYESATRDQNSTSSMLKHDDQIL